MLIQLQISHLPGNQDNAPQFEVVRLSDGKRTKPVTLTSPKDTPLVGNDSQRLQGKLRWYLEDYLRMPMGAYSEMAEDVQNTFKEWGKDCFDKLFSGHARDWFAEARKSGLEKLSIKVSSDDPAVLSWPWEALYFDDDKFIAHRCTIERQLSELGDPLPLSEKLPKDRINILYIIARPYGEGDVGFQTLARPLISYVKEKQLPVNIDVLRPPTFEQLRTVLSENPNFYHIVHFDGHGGYGNTENLSDGYTFNSVQGSLVFEDDNGAEVPIKAETLSQLLAEYRIPVMALNACQSAMIDENAQDPFASVAASLIHAGIRSVVAMGYSLYVSAAKEFVPDFYKRLFESGSVAEAMRAGRQAMYQRPNRDCNMGKHPLQDWLVPTLYQKLSPDETIVPSIKSGGEIERRDLLPEPALDMGDYSFIGRDRAIQKLERAVLRQNQAGLLIHGMAGAGKTTLAKGFLHWLEDTNGLENPVFWFDFREIHNFEYILDTLVGGLFGTNAIAASENEKLYALIEALKNSQFYIVWDNFESASGIAGTEVTPLLSEEERQKLKSFLKKLRGGKTKILITSRSPEKWLSVQECFDIPLSGLQGEEVWEYCNAVVSDLGLKIDRDNEEYAELIEKLDGNPLAIRAVLLRLKERPAKALLEELEKEFAGAEGDESALRILAAFNLFERGLNKMFDTILQLMGLHEHYVQAYYLAYMLQETEYQESTEYISECFTVLENAGFCSEITEHIYQIHPALRSCLAKSYSATETLQRKFVGIMGLIADELAPKELHEQRIPFMLNEANFYRAMAMAQNLGMKEDDLAITQSLASFAFNSRNLSQAQSLFSSLAEKAKLYNHAGYEASTYHQLGRIAEEQRDYKTAETWYKKSLEIEVKQGHEYGAAITYHQLGIIAAEQRDFKSAETWYMKSLEIKLKQGNEHGAAMTYHQLGRLAEEQRDYKTAETWYKKSLEISLKQGNEHGAAMTYHQLGMIAEKQRDYKTAETWYKKSLEIKIKQGNEHGAAITYHQLGRIAEEQRDYKTAETWYKKSLEIKIKQGNEHGAAITYHQLGRIAAEQRDYKTAESWYLKALSIFEKYNDEYNAGIARKNFAKLFQLMEEVKHG